jgi:hypothetical protein
MSPPCRGKINAEKIAIRRLILGRLSLAEAGRAHELFERGEVIGKLLLKP